MKKYSEYLGFLLAIVYGLVIRILGGFTVFDDYEFFSVFSISFLWVTPMIIGLIPILISSNEIYLNKAKQFFYPVLAVLLFLVVSILSGLEDIVCFLIIGAPFILGAGILGLLAGLCMNLIRKHKNKLYSVVVLPFLLSPLENGLPNQYEIFQVRSVIVIDKSPAEIWKQIIEVPEIKDEEYNEGFFQFIGIPRPILSKLEEKEGKMYRVGYFTDDFKLYESISEQKENEFVNFKIHIEQSELRDKPTDKHVLQGDYFKFENISYTLRPINENSTEVILYCDYSINSKMNGYADFWASRIIKDFEIRLLEALKVKFEKE